MTQYQILLASHANLCLIIHAHDLSVQERTLRGNLIVDLQTLEGDNTQK